MQALQTSVLGDALRAANAFVSFHYAHPIYLSDCQSLSVILITVGVVIWAGISRALYGRRVLTTILTELGIDLSAAAFAMSLVFPAEKACGRVPMVYGQSILWIAAIPVIAMLALQVANRLHAELAENGHTVHPSTRRGVLAAGSTILGVAVLSLTTIMTASRI